MTTTTGYKVSTLKGKPLPTRAADSVDEASDASLYCTQQEPLPTPAPRPHANHKPPTPKPRSGISIVLAFTYGLILFNTSLC